MKVRRLVAPQLLVSVRNVAEVEAALAGGCDVLDIKEPGRGALGMADFSTIAAVVTRVRDTHSMVPVSVALGEAGEWVPESRVPRLPGQITYLKLGTAGMEAGAGWVNRFAEVKQWIASGVRLHSGAHAETACDRDSDLEKWIAVGYADWEIAHGPCPEEVLAGARACGCAGVLIDTFSKENGGLLDWLSIVRLESLAELARSQVLEFALAGRLQAGDLCRLAAVHPDIVGIRSAACRAGIRTGEIDAAAIRDFREALRDSFGPLDPARHPVDPGALRIAPPG